MRQYPSIEELIQLATSAGIVMRQNFRRGMARETKSDRTPVTESDNVINQAVQTFMDKYPKVDFIGEEGSRRVEGARYRVFCDPVDGTIPFCRGVPISAFCISVLDGNTPISGTIYDPFMDRMWMAEKDKGAHVRTMKVWENVGPGGTPMGLPSEGPEFIKLKVSTQPTLDHAMTCAIVWKGCGYNMHEVVRRVEQAGSLWMDPASIAYFGGLVASGEFDATIFPGTKPWESAAMQVIIEEAGGAVTDMHGNMMEYGPDGEINGCVASNGLQIHDEIIDLIAAAAK